MSLSSSEAQSPVIIDDIKEKDSYNKLSLTQQQQQQQKQQMSKDNNFGSLKPKMWTRIEGTTGDIETDNDFEVNSCF